MKNVKEIKIEVKGKEWEADLDKAWNKEKKNIKVDGFRKGACPKEVFIKKAGIEALFNGAADIAMEDAYKKAFEQADMEVVCEPSVGIEKIDETGIELTFTFIGRPEVKLGKYTKLGVKREEVKVTKEEIAHEIEHLQDHMAEVVIKENGEVAEGNTAVIDFEGIVDGKKLDGGTGANYPLEIGSHTFIPGFEEGLVGMKTGETKELNLKFPSDYVEELKDKEVTFTVTIREIKERIMPEMNKDFFDDLGIEGVDSKKSLEEHISKELQENKEKQEEDKYVDALLRKATDDMTVEINDEIIDTEVQRLLNQYSQELKMQGATLEQYCQITGTKMEDLQSMMKPQAIATIKTRYLLEEIVKKEKIAVSDEEVSKEITESLEKYGMKEEEFLSAVGGKDVIKYDLEMRKAIEIVKEG